MKALTGIALPYIAQVTVKAVLCYERNVMFCRIANNIQLIN